MATDSSTWDTLGTGICNLKSPFSFVFERTDKRTDGGRRQGREEAGERGRRQGREGGGLEESGVGRYRNFLLGYLVETVGRLLLPKEVGIQDRLGTKPRDKGQLQYLCLHHVDSPGPELSDTVVDVHHTFPFCHVQHDIDDYEAAGPSCPSTAWKEGSVSKGNGPPRCSCSLKSLDIKRCVV